ncbi:MAG TPA: GNAT family N-acetyltransferase [Ktedonosporobacter sp.]|nr:GNAT family N-acetyltransferase [Ktedonosporobacter sp.]
MSLSSHLQTFPLLETKRLVLRQLEQEDAKDIILFLADEETMRFYDPPFKQFEQAEKSIARHQKRFADREAIRWGITLKGEGKVIGNCGYSWDADNFCATLSYILAKPYWNKGIMTEALAAILQFGFDSCQLHRIEAQVALPNHASAQVLRKLGFQEEGLLRERLYVDNQFYDERMFSLLNKSSV